MLDLALTWLIFPALVAAVAVGFGGLVERACGKALPWLLLVCVGFGAYVSWSNFTAINGTAAFAVRWLTLPLAALGLFSIWKTRTTRTALQSRLLVVGPAVAALVSTVPFLASSHPRFGGYTSLSDGAFQMVGAQLLPLRGSGVEGLLVSSISSLLAAYFDTGYPSGSLTALGIPTWMLGSAPYETFQPTLALGVLVTGLATASFVRLVGVVGPRGAGFVGFFAASAPLFQAYALQGSIKEIWAAALSVTVAASIAWAWPQLANGNWRIGVPTGLALAGFVSVIGPGGGPLMVLFAVSLLVLAARQRIALSELLSPAAAAVGTAVVFGAPAILAAIALTKTAAVSMTSDGALGNLAQSLPIWKAFAAWLDVDYRPNTDALSITSGFLIACAVGLFAAAGIWAAARRRGHSLWLAWLFANGAGAAAVIAVGTPWADAKALAILSVVVFSAAGVGIVVLTSGRPTGRKALVVASIAILMLTAFAQFRGVNLSPAEGFDELELIARRVPKDKLVMIADYDPYAKVAFAQKRPFTLGEDYFMPWRVRYENGFFPKPVYNPPLERLFQKDLVQMDWIMLRRGPGTAWPPPNFKLQFQTERYLLFRRTTKRLPKLWTPLYSGSETSVEVACKAISKLGPTGFALLRPAHAVSKLSKRSSSWPQADDNNDATATTGKGWAVSQVWIPKDGNYDVWAEVNAPASLAVDIDGRRGGEIPSGTTNVLRREEPVASQLRLRKGLHTVKVSGSPSWIKPGEQAGGGSIGPIRFEDSNARTTLVSAARLDCSKAPERLPADWVGKW